MNLTWNPEILTPAKMAEVRDACKARCPDYPGGIALATEILTRLTEQHECPGDYIKAVMLHGEAGKFEGGVDPMIIAAMVEANESSNPPAAPTAAVLNSEANDALAKIDAAERKVGEAQDEWDARKEAAKFAKDDYDKAVIALREIIRSLRPGSAPLFEQQASAEEWKTVLVDQISVSDAIHAKLKKSNLMTLGDVAARDGGLDGILTEKQFEMWTAAEAEFWCANPHLAKAA